MKLHSALLLSVSLMGFSAWARPETSGKELVEDIQTLALKCIVRSFSVTDGQKTYGALKNTCPQIQVLDTKTAHVTVDNDVYEVVLRESDDADGGDLDHVLVYDKTGKMVGQKLNVLAFDNILLGLAGGKTSFMEVEEHN